MNPPLFHLRGYPGLDPLDKLTTGTRFGLHMAVTALLMAPFLYIVFFVVGAATLDHDWYVFIELGIAATAYAATVVALRKSSSLVLIALFAVTGMLLDLFVQAHFRHPYAVDPSLFPGVAYDPALGGPITQGPWTYQGLLGALPVQLTFLISWTIDAIVAGPVALWLTRLVAARLPARPGFEPDLVTPAHHAALFRAPWIADTVPRPARGWAFYGFMGIALAYLTYLIFITVALLGVDAWSGGLKDTLEQTFANPAMAINTFVKVSVMVSLLLAAAYNVTLRWHAALILVIGHTTSTVASLVLYFANPPAFPGDLVPWRDFLLVSAVVDALFVAFFLVAMRQARPDAACFARLPEFPSFYSVPHRLTKWAFTGLGLIFVVGFLLVLSSQIPALTDPSHGLGALYGFPLPQVSNSLTQYATLAALAFMLATREALRERLVGIITQALAVGVVASAGFIIVGDAVGEITIATRGGGAVAVSGYFMLLAAINSVLLLVLFALHKLFWVVEYTITTLGPSGARCALALHDAIYHDDAPTHPTTLGDSVAVLTALDRHLGEIRGRMRGLLNAPFPLLEHALPLFYGLRPPLSVMSRDERRWWLRRHVIRPPSERAQAQVPLLAELTATVGVGLHALITLAHYDRRKVWAEVGYVPPDARDRLQGDHAAGPPPFTGPAPLPNGPDHPANWRPEAPCPEAAAAEAAASPAAAPTAAAPAPRRPAAPRRVAPRVVTPIDEPDVPDEVDYLIVGSGAGGATLAYRLACNVADPARILIVERGARYSPLQDMNDRELEMIRRLYKEGGIQQTKRLDMLIMQGECVGGSTVLNNAVCFPLQDAVRAAWANDYGLDFPNLDVEYQQVADELDIAPLPPAGVNTALHALFSGAIASYNLAPPPGAGPLTPAAIVRANFLAPLGVGLGAFGNKRLRKRSMLETYLPWAEARGVKIVSETSALRFHTGSQDERGRATAVTLRSLSGEMRRVTVKKAVIVAAGAVASSHFLMRSDVAGRVGESLSCNLALPITAEYAHPLDAIDGVQIALGSEDPEGRAVFETFANPPATAAVELPFFFGRHHDAMTRYRRQVNLAALVGSEPRGVISRQADLLNGRAVHWSLGRRDQERMGYALATLVDLAIHSQAQRVYLATQPGLAVDVATDGQALRDALAHFPFRMSDFRMFTSHPSGGNVMAADGSREAARSAVDGDFRVRGYDNVYVADASVFPTATVVNPQWTVMALASMAARAVVDRHE